MSLQQYTEAGTYIVLEIQLDKALVPKRMPEELARRCVAMVGIFVYKNNLGINKRKSVGVHECNFPSDKHQFTAFSRLSFLCFLTTKAVYAYYKNFEKLRLARKYKDTQISTH